MQTQQDEAENEFRIEFVIPHFINILELAVWVQFLWINVCVITQEQALGEMNTSSHGVCQTRTFVVQ